MEKVSIIVPVYNMERYLVQCLDSVVGQTYSNLEIVIIDDGSIDSSPKICDEYAEQYSFVSVYHKPNGGLCSARNYGLDRISGDWILFVDSDDWCEIDYVEKLMGKSGERGKEDVVLSSVNSQMRDFSFHVEYSTYLKEGIYDDPEEMKMLHALAIGNMKNWKHKWSAKLDGTGGNGAPWNKLFKREIIEKHGLRFEEETKVWEDLLFNMRYFAYVRRACYVDARGYYYRFVDTGITKKIDINRLKKEEYFFEQVEEYSKKQKENPYFDEAKKQRVSMVVKSLCKYVANAGKVVKMAQLKGEIHNYLQQPMIAHALKTIKLSELNSISVKVAVFLAQHEMIGTMYVTGRMALKLRSFTNGRNEK
ncbi:MAG: glycosyltransferase family 2 protein [Suilimivivens sp.]